MKSFLPNKWLLWVCGITFFAKLLILIFFIDTVSLWEDHDIAVNLSQTGEFKYFHNSQWNYNYQFPVYPFLVSILYSVFGINAKLVIFYHLLLQGFTAVFLYHVFLRFITFFDIKKLNPKKELVSITAVIIFLLHPLINYYALKNIFPFTQSLFFVSATFFFMFRVFENWNTKNILIYSLVLGLAVIDRSTAVTTTLPFLFFCFYSFSFTNAVRKILIVASISILPLCGWVTRNYVVTGHFQLTSSLGENLWLGIQEESEGTTQLSDGKSYYHLLSDDMKQLAGLSAAQQHQFYVNKYKEEWENNPGKVIKMFFVKLKNFWWFRKNIGVDYSESIKKLIPVYMIFYVVTLFFAVVSFFIAGKKTLFLWSYLLALSMMQSMVYVETRHRIIIEPWLIFFAVISVYGFFKTKKSELPEAA